MTALGSTLGKKYLMAITGLIWIGFVIGHLTGNFLLFAGPEAFNGYAHFLMSIGHGKGIYLAEAALVFAILVHVYNGLSIHFGSGKRRSVGYQVNGSAGGRSRKGLASQGMAISGTILLVFLVVHIASFKFGLFSEGEVQKYTLASGVEMVNLYARVVHHFGEVGDVAFYTIVMLMLGMHLKHGAWSALQSLGLLNKKTYPLAVTGATLLALALSFGFLALPGIIFLNHDHFAELAKLTKSGGM